MKERKTKLKLGLVFVPKKFYKGPPYRHIIGFPMNEKLETPRELFLCLRWILSNAIDKFDEPETDKVEWYDFIWSTTRKVRQRVNQFQLRDLDAVYLLEIITRFHIFSMHGMVEWIDKGFYEHLNKENLTRCLITLNQLYNDLNHREIYCTNEEEFRSYIALYFHGGELQINAYRLNPVSRRTPKLKFALECIFALNSKNYIKFFDLVRKADYLTACLLYKHIHVIRHKAFMALNKSHRPLDYRKVDLMRHLGFDSEADVDDFCNFMKIEFNETFVNFDPKNNRRSDERPKESLCRSLIEYKREGIRLSEIIAGEKIIFDESELAGLDSQKFNYTFNEDDDLVWKNELVPIRMLAESIVAEQIWRSIFYSVIDSFIVDTYTRLEIDTPDLTPDESGDEKSKDRIQYISHSIDKKAARKLPSMPGAKVLTKPRIGAGYYKPTSKYFRSAHGSVQNKSKTVCNARNDEIVESKESTEEKATEATEVSYQKVIEERAQETIQRACDSLSEATGQASASDNVNERVNEIVDESENSSSFENADLLPPVESEELKESEPSEVPSTSRDNSEFEAQALSSIMNKVLKVYRKRGKGRKYP